ncbi:LPS-assembly protein LptD [Thermodesulfobacteriota bacterium]
MKKLFILSSLILLSLLNASLLFCADFSGFDTIKKDAPIEIDADNIEYLVEKDVYLVKGNASLTSGKNNIKADEITVDLKNSKAHAKGNVLIKTEGETVNAEEFDLDIKTNQGAMIKGRIFIKSENFYITGDSLVRISENKYVVKNGTFTTCDPPVPSWKFSASRLDIEIDEYVFAYNPVFYVKNVPSMYLPVIIFPIKKTRQSGFLSPTIGYSSHEGMLYKQPYYQVFSDSADATIALDSRSKLGTGADTEFRYVLSEGSAGEVDWFIMDEMLNDDNRWSFELKHTETFAKGFTMKADLKSVSDTQYYNDYGEDVDERNLAELESNITLYKRFKKASIQVMHKYDKDLDYDEAKNEVSGTKMQFPKITTKLFKSSIYGNSPIKYSGEATFNNYVFRNAENFSYLKLNPKLSTDFVLGPYATLSPQITLEKAKFWLYDDETTDNDNYYSYSMGGRISTKVMRVFTASDTLKVKHLLNPVIEYENVPKIDVYESYYSTAEIMDEKKEVTVRLINKLTTRSDDGEDYRYNDPFRLEVSQAYDIYEYKRELNEEDENDKHKPYKQLTFDLDIKAYDALFLEGILYHDHYMKDHIRQYNVAMALKDKRSDELRVKHTYLKKADNYLDTFVNLNLSHGVSVNNSLQYDYIKDEPVEAVYGINFSFQCWGFSVRYSEAWVEDDENIDPDSGEPEYYVNKSLFFYFSLKGLGSTGDIIIDS